MTTRTSAQESPVTDRAGIERGAGTGDESAAGTCAPAEDRRAPGRPRSAKADEAIIEAVLGLLADGVSIEALSMEAVAAKAGVGKATIYRRWPNKERLVVDAVISLKGPIPELSGESLREDLLALLRPMRSVKDTRAGRIMPCIMPEIQRNPEMARAYHELSEPRRRLMRDRLREAVEDGTLRADIDIEMTAAMLAGPMISQVVLNWHSGVDLKRLPEYIVDTVLPGILA